MTGCSQMIQKSNSDAGRRHADCVWSRIDYHLTKKMLVNGEAPDVDRLKLEVEAQFKFAITGMRPYSLFTTNGLSNRLNHRLDDCSSILLGILMDTLIENRLILSI